MLNGTKTVIKHKIGLLNLAEELGNVSKACRIVGLSRDTFYRYQKAVEQGGIETLIDRSRCKPPIRRTEWTGRPRLLWWPMPLNSLPRAKSGPATGSVSVAFIIQRCSPCMPASPTELLQRPMKSP